jgi:hypothetical protein
MSYYSIMMAIVIGAVCLFVAYLVSPEIFIQ